MELLITVLRFVHIVVGVGWAGSAFFLVYFVEPAITSVGPDGSKFMGALMQRGLSSFMSIAALLTVLAGVTLLWIVSGGLSPRWLGSSGGIAFSIGGLAGIADFLLGLAVLAPLSNKMAALGAEIRAAGKPPTAAQGTEMHALQGRVAYWSRVGVVLLGVCVVGMAVGRTI